MVLNLSAVLKDLRELNEPVPIPGRLPSIREVVEAEQQLGVLFHPDYRKFLLEASDVVVGTLEPATVGSDGGHTDLIHVARDAWNLMGVPRDLLPICEDNGNYYLMNQNGEIVFWSHDGSVDERWPDLATWIREVWIEKK